MCVFVESAYCICNVFAMWAIQQLYICVYCRVRLVDCDTYALHKNNARIFVAECRYVSNILLNDLLTNILLH